MNPVPIALRALVVTVIAALALALSPVAARADPPSALSAAATVADSTWMPALDYDTDGCYSTSAIGPDGTLNPGLRPTGALNGACRDAADLANTNTYVRARCNTNGWCAHLYGLYFEKDQAVPGPFAIGGHRHDWEHTVVWVYENQVRYVSVSAHGEYLTYPAAAVAFEGTHPKVVYHKDGIGTHALRLAGRDEQPENHRGSWQYPPPVSWDLFPPGVRDILTGADFGSATLAIRDGIFEQNLDRARPAEVTFDPRQ